ncbi:MAG: DUF4287 domain-containing protein [Leeuwenhoekiella sp.]
MSFQDYIDKIRAKTGISPAGFKLLAQRKGFIKSDGSIKEGVTATEITVWLKNDYNLEQNQAMAIYAFLKKINY